VQEEDGIADTQFWEFKI